jgi:hypothetical protein
MNAAGSEWSEIGSTQPTSRGAPYPLTISPGQLARVTADYLSCPTLSWWANHVPYYFAPIGEWVSIFRALLAV